MMYALTRKDGTPIEDTALCKSCIQDSDLRELVRDDAPDQEKLMEKGAFIWHQDLPAECQAC